LGEGYIYTEFSLNEISAEGYKPEDDRGVANEERNWFKMAQNEI
jgi:hypothetical protein